MSQGGLALRPGPGVSDSIGIETPASVSPLTRRRKAEAAMQIPSVEEVGQLLSDADSNRVSTRKGFRA
ncbi:MAG: hypothetical protein ACRDQA_22785 [Nocardioidaceae bacterium]